MRLKFKLNNVIVKLLKYGLLCFILGMLLQAACPHIPIIPGYHVGLSILEENNDQKNEKEESEIPEISITTGHYTGFIFALSLQLSGYTYILPTKKPFYEVLLQPPERCNPTA